MQTIKIFIASSAELKEDRDQFRKFISKENDRLHKNGYYLEIVQWENFLDAISDTRLQDEYNNAICNCDIVICLFFTKVGKYTAEEFDTAYQNFKNTQRPKIWTYFKNAPVNTGSITDEINTLLTFKKKIGSIGHFFTEYTSIDNLINQYRTQLDMLLAESQFFLAGYDEMIDWDWNGKTLLRHLIAIDYETTDNLNEVNEGTADQWAPVFERNPKCWQLLAIREKELAGYWCFFPLKKDQFDKMKNGLIEDGAITFETIENPNEDGKYDGIYNIYIVMFTLKENYRKIGLRILLRSLLDRMDELNRDGMRINEICANAFSPEGESLCYHLGFTFYKNHITSGRMFITTYDKLQKNDIWNKFKKTVDGYKAAENKA